VCVRSSVVTQSPFSFPPPKNAHVFHFTPLFSPPEFRFLGGGAVQDFFTNKPSNTVPPRRACARLYFVASTKDDAVVMPSAMRS